MSILSRQACFLRHSPYLSRIEVRRTSLIKRFDARFRHDTPTLDEVHRLASGFNRRLEMNARCSDAVIRLRLEAAYAEWAAADRFPTAAGIIRRLWEGGVS